MNRSLKIQELLLTGGCALTVLVAPAWAASKPVVAQLDRLGFPVGESAQLAVTVKGTEPAQPTIPPVDGLRITPLGQQSSMRVINGTISAEVRYLYRVTPEHPGNFTIPAIEVPGAETSQPIAFRVDTPSTAPRSSQSRPTVSSGSSQSVPAATRRDGDGAREGDKAQTPFLRVVMPKADLTVGELVPVELKACFPAGMGASLNGLPMLSGGAFTLNKLGDNPEQTREIIDGQPYNVITWSSTLSAAEAGEHALNIELPVMVRVQEKGARGGRDPFKDFFGEASPFEDSAFDDFFGQVTEKPLTLHSDGTPLKIRPLPQQGRPLDFSGAVGKFDLSAEVSQTTAVRGDPITLKTKIVGQGNFDRVTTNGLSASTNWKSYKPSARFESADGTGLTGTKTFEQSIVPMGVGSSEIPSMSFSYFDPEAQSYVTRTTNPIPIEILPGNSTVPARVSTANSATAPAHSGGPVPDQPRTGLLASLRPVVLEPWFLTGNALMVAATMVLLLVTRSRQRLANHPERARAAAAKSAVRQAFSDMDEAIKRGSSVGFFQAARQAVTKRLAEQWSLPASQVTPAEIHARLNGNGEKICALFKRGDQVAYSHEQVTVSELNQWRADIAQALNNL